MGEEVKMMVSKMSSLATRGGGGGGGGGKRRGKVNLNVSGANKLNKMLTNHNVTETLDNIEERNIKCYIQRRIKSP